MNKKPRSILSASQLALPDPDLAPQETGLRWLVLDMNSFFASCEQQENPALRGLPVAVAPVLVETTCAIAASYAAKAFGVKTGTPIHQARVLCPGIRVVQARPKLYVDYHHRVLEAIDTCVPIHKVMSIDEVACQLDQSQQQPANARALGMALKQAVRERVGECLTSSVGIAPNVLLAKLASNMQKPDGLTLLSYADLPHAILHLDIRAISGIGPRMARRLEAAGLPDMASLWAADSLRLRQVWQGVGGLQFHTLLHGGDFERPASVRRSLGHQHVLGPDERRWDKATNVLRQLLVRAAQRLRHEEFYCRCLVLHVKRIRPHVGHLAWECRMHETQDTGALLATLMDLWQQAPREGLLRIGVTLCDLVPAATHQHDLFERPVKASLTRAIDTLNARYGRNTVSYGPGVDGMTSKIAFNRVPERSEF